MPIRIRPPHPPPLPAALPSGEPRSRRQARGLALGLGVCLASALAESPVSPAWADPGAEPAPTELAQQLLAEVNDYRAQSQLPPWSLDLALVAIAAGQSASVGPLTHNGFADRFRRAQRRVCVESLASGFDDAAKVVAAWRASPAHEANLCDVRVSRVGIANTGRRVAMLACSEARALPGR